MLPLRFTTMVVAIVATVAATVGVALPAQAAPHKHHQVWSPPQTPLPRTPSVPGNNAPVLNPAVHVPMPVWQPPPAAWPAPGAADVTAAATAPDHVARVRAALAGKTKAGILPLWIGAPTHSAGVAATAIVPTPVHVELASHAAAQAAGVNGLLFTVSRAGKFATAQRASVAVDYSAFASAFGGDYGSRLRLVSLPVCALTTPAVAACQVQTPITSAVNDTVAHTLVSDVDVPAMTVLAASTAPAGSTGTYSATSLKASDAWTAGGSSGAFDYTYPIAMPATLGGNAPAVKLSYDSASLDGQTVSTNAQTSWLGDGWSYGAGFVERAYKPCATDGIPGSGDMCWGGNNNLTLSLAGHAGEIVRDDSTGTYHLSNDDGAMITQITNAANGSANNEAWQVTTSDGTTYYFGLDHLPTGNHSDASTNAAWGEPVYSPKSGDPCYSASTGQSSWCQMAWRWNLDFVVDAHGNLTTYTYSPETNYYTRGGGQGTGTLSQYIRGGTLSSISYGYRLSEALAGAKPAAQVVFAAGERCITSPSTCQYANLSASTASNWPDVPYDQNCASTGTCSHVSPSFWSTRMLSAITTQVLVGSSYRVVDTYTLAHQFPDNGDGTSPNLWLASIGHTGSNGQAAVSTPNVVFYGTELANRVPGAMLNGAALPQVFRWRVQTIDDETGAGITATYAPTVGTIGACSQSNPVRLPTPGANTMLCFPQYWNPPGSGSSGPVMDWFQKYVVTSVAVNDLVGGAPARVTRYTYQGNPAWHSNDSELTDAAQRTWDGWRGFGQVTTTSGTAPDSITASMVTYLRGMDQDINSAGQSPPVTVTDSQGNVYTDDNALAGFVLETQTYANSGGAVTGDKINTPSLTTTATHVRISPLPAQRARLLAVSKRIARNLLVGNKWRTTEADYTYDAGHANRLTQTDDKGDGSASAPELCTTTFYGTSTTMPQMQDRVSRQRVIAGACGNTPTAANTVSDTRSLFDGANDGSFGQITGAGDVTATEVIDHYDGSGNPVYITTATSSYDGYGRVTAHTDPNSTDSNHPAGATTTTSFTPATGALPTQATATSPYGWQTTTTLDPGRGQPVHIVDPNGGTTDLSYDALGRLTAVWAPGHAKSAYASLPNQKYSYSLNGVSGPSWVQTQTLREDSTYANSYQILNGFAQTRQIQADAPDASGGRVITDTFYESHGWTVKTATPYYNSGAPAATVFVANDNAVPGQTVTGYDGQGRVTTSTFYSYANPQWSSTKAYPGADEIDVTPAAGSSPSTSILDARGRTIALWRYHTPTATGVSTDADITTYTYNASGTQASVTDATTKNTWSYGYDLRGRKTSISDPDAGTSTVTFDNDSRPVTSIDGRGQSLSDAYDLIGRKIGEYSGASITNPSALLASWKYDTLAKGQLTSSTRYAGGASGAAYVSAVTGYTADNKPTGNSITIPSTEGALAGTYTTSMQYTPVTGLLSETDLPAVGDLPADALGYGYQPFGLLASVGGNGAYLTNVAYDPFGKPTRTTLGDMPLQAVQTTLYDDATGRPLTVTVDKENGSASTDITSYTYNPSGQITSTRDKQDNGAIDLQCFGYDNAQRLATVWTDTGGTTTAAAPSVPGIGKCANTAAAANHIGGPAAYWQTYSYDVAGNRTTEVDKNVAGNTALDVTHAYTFPGAGSPGPHQLSSTSVSGGKTGTDTFTYDTAGNMVSRKLSTGTNQTLTWDAEGKLATVKDNSTGKTSGYVYDASGGLLVQHDPAETVIYLAGQEIHRNTGSGAVTGVRYVSTPGGPNVVITGASLSYKFGNQQNTASVSIDGNSLAVTRRYFDPYGRVRGTTPSSWPDSRAFLDKPLDASTGLTIVGARAYDSANGRFISADPVFQQASPDQMGGYTYSGNDPVNSSDPTGLDPASECAGLTGPAKGNCIREALDDDRNTVTTTTHTDNEQQSSTTTTTTTTSSTVTQRHDGNTNFDYLVATTTKTTSIDTVTVYHHCSKDYTCPLNLNSALNWNDLEPRGQGKPWTYERWDGQKITCSQIPMPTAGGSDAVGVGCHSVNRTTQVSEVQLPKPPSGNAGTSFSICLVLICYGVNVAENGATSHSWGFGLALGVSEGPYVSTSKTDHIQFQLSGSVGVLGASATNGPHSGGLQVGPSLGLQFGATMNINGDGAFSWPWDPCHSC